MATTQGVKLDDNTRDRLKALAAKRDRTPHWLMKKAIQQYLEKEERYEKEKAEDEARWRHYVETGEAIDNEVVERWLQDLSEGKPSSWQKYVGS